MATSNHCPRCGLALEPGGEGLCVSCRARPRSKRPRRNAELDFTADEPGPQKRPRNSSGHRGLVLAGVALFLVLGTALTGYCFALTFLNKPEAPPVVTGPPPPPAPAEDWRTTLQQLRGLVRTPPQLVAHGPPPPRPPEPPSRPGVKPPPTPIVQRPPETNDLGPRVNRAIDKGSTFLKQRIGEANRATALVGLTLRECGVSPDDPAVRRAVEYARGQARTQRATYDLCTYVWLLDRLGQPQDRALIRSLALRLINSQGPTGGWGYTCHPLTVPEESRLEQLLANRPLPADWRRQMMDAKAPVEPAPLPPPRTRPPARADRLDELPVFRWQPSRGLDMKPVAHEDNSLTQFAILALWAARKHGVAAERSLAFAEHRFRANQNADGSWGYKLQTRSRRDSMTCAGLLGLAVGRGLNRGASAQEEVQDEAIKKALVYVGQIVGRPPPRTTGPRGVVGAEAWGDLYYLWSLERMAVVWDLKTVANKDWYAWGSGAIVRAQAADGSWAAGHGFYADTCFALLFLKRVNVVQDLTAQLRLLGKVKDPGELQPSIVLAGDALAPDK